MVKLREEQKEELIKKEKERRRIARLRQVRQQSAAQAKVIRDAVNEKKKEEIEKIAFRTELREVIESEGIEIENLSPERAPELTPRTKKAARRREVTSEDIRRAKRRNSEALLRLQKTKLREKREKEQKLAKRRLAEQKATEIMREGL